MEEEKGGGESDFSKQYNNHNLKGGELCKRVDLRAQNEIQSQSQSNHNDHGGRPKAAPRSLLLLFLFSGFGTGFHSGTTDPRMSQGPSDGAAGVVVGEV